MDLHALGIRLLQRAGLYVRAREVFHRLSPSRRRSRRAAQAFYAQFVGRGALCFDIGANVGQTSEALLALGARVVAVEPNPLCIPVLQQRFGSNPRFHLQELAVGAAPGRASLHFEGTASTASLRDDWPFPASQAVDVAVTTLAELIGRWGTPQLLKVDVEGFEVEVFRGLDRAVPVIYFEMHTSERDRALAVLARLGEVGRIEQLNVTDVDHRGWLFPQWIDAAGFVSQPVERFPRTCNVVVRMASGR